jgi:hypothetical protein
VKPLRLALAIAVAALVGSPLEAAVLQPGSILVAGRDQLLLIDPERRPPEVVSSTTVGGGEPYEGIVDFDVARDGFVYAAVPGPAIHRIDPATGDRELVSSRDRGQGVDFVVAWAIAVARNRVILSCTDEDPGLALAPRDLVEQFCATFEPIGMAMPAADCVWADWRADDDGRRPRDCRARRGHCVPM